MVLTPGYIKVIAKEIASQIITELKKPLEKPFSSVESVRVRKVSCSDKNALIDYFKNHERRTDEKIENERRKN